MAPLRTGAARIALMAEERAGWRLGLRVQPVGLTYVRKHLFRGRALAAYGKPIAVGRFREEYERAPRDAVRRLTEAIGDTLVQLTVNYEHAEDRDLVDVAERLYAREKGLSRSRERDPLAERMPRLKRFAEGLARLRVEDPARLSVLQGDVTRYMHMLVICGVREGDLPRRYRPGAVAVYVLRHLAMLLLILPAAIIGALFWAVPYLCTDFVSKRFRPKLDQVATYKLGVAILASPVWARAGGGGGVGFVGGGSLESPCCSGPRFAAWRRWPGASAAPPWWRMRPSSGVRSDAAVPVITCRRSAPSWSVRVSADIDPAVSNNNRVNDSLRETVLPALAARYNVGFRFEGRAADQAETLADMRLGMVFGLAMIYLVLAWVFASYGWPLVVMVAIPFGLIGAITGHYLLGIDLTILSLFGFFGLSGIVVNDSIILVMFFKHLREQGMPYRDAIVEASCQRLRAVLLTSLTTIGGLTPLLFESSLQAQFLIPMAVSISFGLAFATVLVLVVIPALLLLHEAAAERLGGRRQGSLAAGAST